MTSTLTIEYAAIRLDFYEAVDIVIEEMEAGGDFTEAMSTAISFVLENIDSLPEMTALLEVLYDEGYMDFDHETVLAVVLTEMPEEAEAEENLTNEIEWEMTLEEAVRGNDDFGGVISKFTHAALLHGLLEEVKAKRAA